MSDAPDVTITDNPERKRFEARVGDQVAGFVAYRIDDYTITFEHTEVDDAYEGQGIGSRLARGALDGARALQRKVVAECPFIKSYIERHDEYQDLVA